MLQQPGRGKQSGKGDLNLFSPSEWRDDVIPWDCTVELHESQLYPCAVGCSSVSQPSGPTALTVLEELVHTARDAFIYSRMALLYRHNQMFCSDPQK